MMDKFYSWIDKLPDWVYSLGLISLAFTLGYVVMGGME